MFLVQERISTLYLMLNMFTVSEAIVAAFYDMWVRHDNK